jgi:mRNA interferase RelE/StbE
MAEYSITFARSARKELEKLTSTVAQRIMARIESLMKVPRPSGAVKLQGDRNLWRIRIGDYRVIYSIDDSARVLDISAVRNRRDAYRDL